MSLKATVTKKTNTRPPRLLDRIYAKLNLEDQQTLRDLMADRDITGYTIADALTELGHPINYSTINLERRNSWEPM